MAHPAHQFWQRSTCLSDQRVTGTTKIMYVNISWQARFGQGSRPGLGEVAAPELAALDAYEDKSIRRAPGVQDWAPVEEGAGAG
jgi:hypothetical protein